MKAALPMLGALLWASAAQAQGVAGTPHNLSVTGPGPLHARSETEICIFCHGVHNTSPQAPLWNRRDSGGTYRTYASSTLPVSPGQPSGASRLCLSCHDGTIALGDVLTRRSPIEMVGSGFLDNDGSLGTDLGDDHPFSFNYASAVAASSGTLRPAPFLGGRSAIDNSGQVQCTSCHEPHDNRFGKFLRVDPRNGALCTTCHAPPEWPTSSHATSTKSLSTLPGNPFPGVTVAQNACKNCHVPHGAGSRSRLLWSDVDEAICLTCHNGIVSTDIGAELRKWSGHDVTASSGLHDAAERPDGRRTHVECVDCHNPHATRPDLGGAGGLGGELAGPITGVDGLDLAGMSVSRARAEYEICLKCHADTNDPAERILRVVDQPNIRRAINPANPSFHPIAGPGRGAEVPSLRPPYTTLSTLACTDCHANDAGPGAGGAGPRGPHGSRWPWLLERRYETADPVDESPDAYALCYKCHERGSILADQSFASHRKHVVGARTPCSVCHDAHGIDGALGTPTGDAHLVNFDRRVVLPNAKGERAYESLGIGREVCSLRCHGVEHDRTGN